MKMIKWILSLVAVVSFALPAEASKKLKIGDAMPKIEKTYASMKATDGKTYTIDQIKKDKGTLVVFTCNHCPYVKLWEDRMAAIANEYASSLGVVFINSNDPEKNKEDGFTQMQARAKKLGLKVPYAVDSTSNIARAYGATKTPEVFLFDGSGKLVYKGAVDDSSKEAEMEVPFLRNAITALLAGKPITKAESKAVGCGIKFREKTS